MRFIFFRLISWKFDNSIQVLIVLKSQQVPQKDIFGWFINNYLLFLLSSINLFFIYNLRFYNILVYSHKFSFLSWNANKANITKKKPSKIFFHNKPEHISYFKVKFRDQILNYHKLHKGLLSQLKKIASNIIGTLCRWNQTKFYLIVI